MDKQTHLDLYYQMVLIRRMEERGAELYQAGKIGGFMQALAVYLGRAIEIACIKQLHNINRPLLGKGKPINIYVPSNSYGRKSDV